MTEKYQMQIANFGNVSQEKNPRILATDYMMYKIGRLTVSNLHRSILDGLVENIDNLSPTMACLVPFKTKLLLANSQSNKTFNLME